MSNVKNITAKQVYIFSLVCKDIQVKNIQELKDGLKNLKITRNNKREVRKLIKQAEEKIDFLDNTMSIVEALYEKKQLKLTITDDDVKKFQEEFEVSA